MNRAKFVIILLLLYSAVCPAQVQKKYTLEIFEKGISGELEKLFYYPDVNRNFQFVFVVTGSDNKGALDSKFITSIIRKTAEKDNIRFSFTDSPDKLSKDSVFYIIKITDINLVTKYPRFIKNRFLGDKTLERNIAANIAVDMKSSDNTFSHKDNIVFNYHDEIDYDTYDSYESVEFGFTKAKPPKVSAFESVLFPVLLVTVSAAATILFFTIRSK